ncbi:hypothetical protein LINPERPRIM_LOCUS8244 [Linum perenne]
MLISLIYMDVVDQTRIIYCSTFTKFCCITMCQ